MDHKAFLATLDVERMEALTHVEDRAGLLHLSGHLGLIAASSAVIMSGLPGWWLALPFQGVFLVFLFALAHEATHRTPFASTGLNDWAGRMAGFPLLLPFEWFRYFHFAHHRYTNIPGKDPELLSGAKPETRTAFVWMMTGLPYWASMARQLWRNALGTRDAFIPPRAAARIQREARWMFGLYGLALASLVVSPAVIWLWVVPVLLGQPFLRLYLLAEHGRCAHVENMFENTRTTFTARAIRFLAWNMPFHTAHHTLPGVPFHKLPEFDRDMRGMDRVTSDGFVEFLRDHVATLDGRA